MKKIITLVPILFLLNGLFPASIQASHLIGTDLAVVRVGNDSLSLIYKMTLTVTGYCDPNASNVVPLGTTVYVEVKSASLNYSQLKMMVTPQSAEDTLDQLCRNTATPNSCNSPGSLYPGYVRRIYTDTLLLPGRAADFTFSFNAVSRSNSSTNIDPQLNQALYVDAGLNNLSSTKNSTPIYDSLPIVYACVNQTFHFINYPRDLIGDSLVTYPIAPRGTNGAFSYLGGFSITNPFGVGSSYHVDSLTGTATFRAANTGRYVTCFRTDKYDRSTHKLLGFTTRDIQIPVFACANAAPVLTGLNNMSGARLSANGTVEITAGTAARFEITGSGTGGSLALSADNTVRLPGSSFSRQSGTSTSVTGTFAWTPANAQVGNYTFRITLSDTTCNGSNPLLQQDAVVIPVKVVRNTTGVAPTAQISSITVSPNPATQRLYISSGNQRIEEISIIDIRGQLILKEKNTVHVIDLKNLASGHYILKASGNFGACYTRFIKQ